MTLDAPNSEVAICNLALIHLKQELVTQIDPPTTNPEQLCALLYHQVRRQTLRGHPWNFALKRASLTPDTLVTVPLGFTYAYAKPVDFIRYVSRHDDLGHRIHPDEFALEGGHLLLSDTFSASTTINIRYVYDHVTVTAWDALFTQLFALNLAIELAPNFSASEKRLGVLREQQSFLQSEAASIDGQEQPPKRVQHSKFLQARRGLHRGLTADRYTRFS